MEVYELILVGEGYRKSYAFRYPHGRDFGEIVPHRNIREGPSVNLLWNSGDINNSIFVTHDKDIPVYISTNRDILEILKRMLNLIIKYSGGPGSPEPAIKKIPNFVNDTMYYITELSSVKNYGMVMGALDETPEEELNAIASKVALSIDSMAGGNKKKKSKKRSKRSKRSKRR